MDVRSLPPREEWPEIRLMVKIATLHYEEGLAQKEIADLTELSPSTISRLLKKARQQNILKVEIKNPLPFELEEERFLERTFKLRDAIVVVREVDNEEQIVRAIGAVAADHFLSLVRDNMTIAIGQGTTMRALVDRVKSIAVEPRRVTVVPLVGGLTRAHPETHTNFLARELATSLGGTHLEMYAPQLADSEQNRNAFMSDSSIEYVLSKARAADIVLTGIGDVSPTSRLITLCSFTRTDMERLNTGGAVGEVNSNFFNANGQACCPEFNNRVVGLTIDEIKRIPLVIGVGGGDRKVSAIQSILRNDVLDVLVTDAIVARKIHELEQPLGSTTQ